MTALADLQCTSPSKSICLAGTTLKKEGVSVPNRADSLRGHTNQEYSHSSIWQFFQLIESSVVFDRVHRSGLSMSFSPLP